MRVVDGVTSLLHIIVLVASLAAIWLAAAGVVAVVAIIERVM